MHDLGYDREDLVSGVGEHLDKLEFVTENMAAELRPSDEAVILVEATRSRIRMAMDAARAALDEAVLEQRAIASERLGVEQRRVVLAKAALRRALEAMEGNGVRLEDIDATRAAIVILGGE